MCVWRLRRAFVGSWGILAGIEKSILIDVFHEWRKRNQKCIDPEGEYMK
jgi:hypothetical protein